MSKKFIKIFTGLVFLVFLIILLPSFSFPKNLNSKSLNLSPKFQSIALAQTPQPKKTIDLKPIAERTTISDAINPKISASNPTFSWIFTIWKFCLSLVNSFALLVLILIGLANIVRFNIDTYAIKKSLPKLIAGILLANASLLICRMLVDFSSVLTIAFAGDTLTLANGLINALGLAGMTGVVGIMGGILVVAFMPAVGLMALLVAIILVFLPAIALLVLAFLLWVRIAVICVFAAVSPLAFVAMATPPTEGFFKSWFSQFLRWVFMAPVVFFLLKIVSLIGKRPATEWIPFIVALAILFLAIQVPFKMGGAVMAAWGKFGGWISGTRPGGYARRFMGKRYERAGKELYSSKLGFLPRWAKVRGELGDLTMNKRVEKAEEAEWLRLQKGVAEKERLGEPLTDADRRIKSKTRDAYTNEAKGLENLSATTIRDELIKRQTDDQELTKWLTHDLPANKQVEIGGRLQRLQQLQRSTDPNERAVATKALEDMDLLIQDAGGGGEVRLESMDLASRKREHPALMGGGGGGGKVTLPPEEVSTLAKALSLGKIDNDSSEKIAHYFDQFNEEFKREAKKSRDELVSYLQSQFNLGKEVSHAITENLHRGLILPDALAHPDIKVKLNPDQVKMVGSERFRSAIEERAKKVFDLGRAQANLHTVNFEENVAVPVKIALNAQPHSIDASQIEATLDKQLQEAQNIAKNISQRKYTLPEIKTQIQAKFSPGIEEVANEDQWREELGKRIGHLVEGIKKLQQEEVLKAIKARNTALDRNAPLKDLLDAARTHYNQDYNIKE